MFSIEKITELAHYIVAWAVREGDLAVDATAGNGHDTIFLAGKVGLKGHVYSFDVQQEALDHTLIRLEQQQLEKQVTLIREGHEQMQRYIEGPVIAVMYNLGYLPGGNRRITTKHDTTIISLKQALQILAPRGIITMVLYPGHPEGNDEKKHLAAFCKELDPEHYTVLNSQLFNRFNKPPELIVVQRK